jgi:hypothetical protein
MITLATGITSVSIFEINANEPQPSELYIRRRERSIKGAGSDEGGHLFQTDRGHHSDLMAAGVASSHRSVLVIS